MSSREYKRKAKKQARDEGIEGMIEVFHDKKGRLMRVMKSEKKGTPEWQKNVAIATNAAGAVAGPAAITMAVQQARKKEGGIPRKSTEFVESKSKPTSRTGKLARKTGKLLRNPKAVAAGGVTAVGLQTANWAGDTIAARALTEQKKKDKVAKSYESDVASGLVLGGAAGAVAGTTVDRTFRRASRAANAPLKGSVFRAKGGSPAVGSLLDRTELRARGMKASSAARMGRFARRNKAALIGAAAAGAVGGMSVEKSIEQSYVSKSDEVAITGHGVNLAKSANGSRGVIGDKEWEGSAKRRARSEGAAGAAVGGTLGGAAGFSAAELARRGNRKIAAAGAAAGAVAGAAGLGSARYQSRKKRAMDPKMRRMAEATVMRQTVNEMRANGKNVTVNTAKWPELADVAKRQFDAEADRQRRLGLYAGLGALGAGGFGAAALKDVEVKGKDSKNPRQVLRVSRKANAKSKLFKTRTGALLGAAALSGGAGLAAYKRGISERNYPYN